MKRWQRVRPRVHAVRQTKGKVVYTAWRLTWYEAGVRKRRQYATQSAAREEAARLNAIISQTETHQTVLSPEEAASIARAREHLRDSQTPIEIACAEYASAKAKIGKVSLGTIVDHWLATTTVQASMTVQRAVSDFLGDKERDGVGERQIGTLRALLQPFREAFASHDCASLTAVGIDGYLMKRQADRKWSSLTRNHHRAAISNFCTWCKRKGYLPRNWSEIEFVAVAKHSRGAVGIFTPEDGSKLLKASQGHARVLIAIGMFAGIRPSEICRLHWSDFDWARKEIHVGKQKLRTAGNRIVPILPALEKALSAHLGASVGRVYPFTHHTAAHDVVATARAAGIEWIQDGLRHSFVSYRLAMTGDIARVSEETGTDAGTLRRHYRRPIGEEVARKWFEIPFDAPA